MLRCVGDWLRAIGIGGTPRTRTELNLLAREVRGPCACPIELVPGVGFEPTSPRLRRGAFTRLASQAIGTGSENRTRVFAVAPRGSAIELCPHCPGAQSRTRTCEARR